MEKQLKYAFWFSGSFTLIMMTLTLPLLMWLSAPASTIINGLIVSILIGGSFGLFAGWLFAATNPDPSIADKYEHHHYDI
ncbi:hypothetical protein B0H94_10559 [Salsuginibacillus halophilus]|uniref:Uncharacterized protein n=1 Tax=Salsuginibacillus halophilus TaxID=517424 RepID=A0A2P8HL17_9BACI|nr:hypothetical protein [Salsuginibacillus halophilus]PSL46909.1 hypothetical protein B0H94_10559 [Salsuginibacillus halophilus]